MKKKQSFYSNLDITQDTVNISFENEKYLDKKIINSKKRYLLLKKVLDLFGSLFGLVMLSPLFLIVAIAIKIEEPKGAVFFSQVRLGKNGKPFKIYKFRSMCIDAEEKLKELLAYNEVEGAMFKMKDDPRITKIGKFIRRTSIDELPQFYNVLMGDMSLVGPRPPLPYEVDEYTQYDKQRLYVKPGCTGLWQISGRNDVGFSKMVKLDIHYVKQQSIVYDIKIIIKTVWVMINPNGAY